MLKKIILVSCVFFTALSFAGEAQLLDKVVAVVNDAVITASELDTEVNTSKKQLVEQKKELPPEAVLRKQVLQRLIDVHLQLQIAKKAGISVDNMELDGAIGRIAEANHMSLEQLHKEIEKHGISWKDYRHNIRKEMLMSRLQQKAVGKDVLVTNEQVEEFLKTTPNIDASNLIYHLENIVIPLKEEPTSAQLKQAQVKAQQLLVQLQKGADFSHLALESSGGSLSLLGGDLGERHLAELPEIFAKEVLHMKVGQVVGPLRAGNGLQLIKLVAVKGENQRHMITQTHVRHILIKPEASMLPSESLKQANNMYQQLKAGKPFDVMARQYSADPSTAPKGGDLGWVSPGVLVPEFEKSMNTLALNQISHPVKSQFGWHLIQVLGRKQVDDSEAFKKQQVRQFLQQRKFAEAVDNWQQHMRSDAYVHVLEKELA